MAKPFSGILKLAGFALILYLGLLFWQEFGPKKPTLSEGRKAVAQAAVTRIVEDLRASRGELKKVAILHFKNDSTGYITGIVRKALDENGIFIVANPSLADQVREKPSLEFPDYDSLDTAIQAAMKLKTDAVIFGHITIFETTGKQSKLQLAINYADVQSKSILFQKEYVFTNPIALSQPMPTQKEESSLQSTNLQPEIARPSLMKVLQMIAAYIVLILIIPVLSIAFIRAMVKKKSNTWNAILLSIYTGIDALLGWVFIVGPCVKTTYRAF